MLFAALGCGSCLVDGIMERGPWPRGALSPVRQVKSRRRVCTAASGRFTGCAENLICSHRAHPWRAGLTR